MSDQENMHQLELSLEAAEASIKAKESLLKLTENQDFKDVVTVGYFEKEASRLVLMKADPSMAKPEHQLALDNAIIAVGNFRQYLMSIMQIGNMAEKAKADDEQTREDLLQED